MTSRWTTISLAVLAAGAVAVTGPMAFADNGKGGGNGRGQEKRTVCPQAVTSAADPSAGSEGRARGRDEVRPGKRLGTVKGRACGRRDREVDDRATPQPSESAGPTATAEPTVTAEPSVTAKPTQTAEPSATDEPTAETEAPAPVPDIGEAVSETADPVVEG